MKRIAFMFPGQGSQAVGMGKEFYDEYAEVQELFHEADRLLDTDISTIMFEGTKEKLTETENAQPALLLSSIAVYTLLSKEKIQPVMAVGHSLGEYSALVASGAISFDATLPLVAFRGRLMEQAFPKGKGAMAAVLGMTRGDIEQVLQGLAEDEVVDIANINCPGQIVISGSKEGMEKASTLLKENGAKRVLPLNVSGPFHSRLMKPANEAFSTELNGIDFHSASIPVYANVTGDPATDKEEIKDQLIRQLYSPVLFEDSIRNMIDEGVDAFVEVGNGKVLSGLVKKIDRNVKTFAVQDPTSLNDFIKWYREDS